LIPYGLRDSLTSNNNDKTLRYFSIICQETKCRGNLAEKWNDACWTTDIADPTICADEYEAIPIVDDNGVAVHDSNSLLYFTCCPSDYEYDSEEEMIIIELERQCDSTACILGRNNNECLILSSVDTVFLRKLIKTGDTGFIDDLVGGKEVSSLRKESEDTTNNNNGSNNGKQSFRNNQNNSSSSSWRYVLFGMMLMYFFMLVYERRQTGDFWKSYKQDYLLRASSSNNNVHVRRAIPQYTTTNNNLAANANEQMIMTAPQNNNNHFNNNINVHNQQQQQNVVQNLIPQQEQQPVVRNLIPQQEQQPIITSTSTSSLFKDVIWNPSLWYYAFVVVYH